MNTKLITRYAIRETLSIFGVAVALFWSAGTITWWAAWTVLAVNSAWLIATAVVIFRIHPDLLAERMRRGESAKSWDKAIVSTLGLVQLVRYILAGLDYRYAWTGGVPLAAQAGALAVCILGYGLFVWAMASNPFFSQVVRIQSERGQAVVSNGPYHYARHPAYFGVILYELAVSILLASWWAMIASGLCVLLLILRTALEDQALLAELAGYPAYARQVRYRLLPGAW